MRAQIRAKDARGRPGGIGGTSSATAERISDDLRLGSSPHLTRRRRAAALLLGASASMGVATLYQLGLVRYLPDPPLDAFDPGRAGARGATPHHGSTPEAALGLASYAVSLALIGMGTGDRAREQPWIPLLAAAKLGADAAGAVVLAAEQLAKDRELGPWHVVAAAATAAAVPLALPEAREALAQVRAER
jgi:hypothetical protein